MFDGLDLGTVAAQAGAQRGFGDQLGIGGDFDDRFQVHTSEHHAMIDRSRS